MVDRRRDFESSSTKENTAMSAGDSLLDPNHTHFILVDDGSDSKYGTEIKLRTKLVSELKRGKSLRYYEQKRERLNKLSQSMNASNAFSEKSEDCSEEEVDDSIPMILIVVQGGPNTLSTVTESIKENIPILVLVVRSKSRIEFNQQFEQISLI
jgi:transient receptor potential cation channel subfamily M protein 2